MSDDRLELAIEPDGVLRLRALPATRLALKLEGAPVREGAALRLELRGTSTGLPDGTRCSARCVWKDEPARATTHVAKLTVRDWKPASTQPCSLSLALPIVEARLFGKGAFDLELTPDFPQAEPTTVPGIAFDHPFQVEPSRAEVELLVGDTITFQPRIDAQVFAGCRVRVEITEADEGKGETASEDDLRVHLEWGGQGPALDAARTWRVGCDAGGLPDYAEPDEKDGVYEFVYSVQASMDDKAWTEAVAPRPLCKVKRPRLTSFALVEDDTPGLRGTEAALRALAREKHGPRLGRSRLHAQGTIEGLAPDLHVEVGVTLWTHRPAPWPGGEGVRIMAPWMEKTGAASGGTFKVLFFDGADLSPEVLRDVASGDLQLFGALRFPAHARQRLPLEDVLDYDARTFRPFGDDDLPRPTKGQRAEDVATSACTAGVVGLSLTRAPLFGPLEESVAGEVLVLRARLLGGTLEYWTAAAPRIELQVEGEQTWQDGGAVLEGGASVAARFAMGSWAGRGKQVTFRARVSNETARLGDAQPYAPAPVARKLLCSPAVTFVTAKRTTKEGAPALAIRASTRYVPTAPTSKALTVELRSTMGVPLPKAKLEYHLPRGTGGACEPADGALIAWVTDPALLPQVGLVRVHGGELFGLPVQEGAARVDA